MLKRNGRRWVLFLVGLSATFLVSCSQTSTESPTSPGVSASASGDTEFLARVAENENIQPIVAKHNLSVISYDSTSGLFEFSTATDLAVLQNDSRFVDVGDRVTASSADDANLIVAFSEGDWEEYEDQSAFDCLQLDLVHQYATGDGIKIAVLDTGLDTKHPHLTGRFKLLDNATLGTGVEVQGNGFDDDGDGNIDEAFGHGTHVAGVIATVAPGAQIIPIRVLNDDGRGTDTDVAAGLIAALRQDVDIVNLSLTMSAESPTITGLLEDLAAAGIHVIAAAGNQPTAAYPATYPTVYGVAASGTGVAGQSCTHLWSGSASGAADISFAGAGYAIASAYPTPPGQIPVTLSAKGTSVGTAVVSGAFAVMLGSYKQTGPHLTDVIKELELKAIALTSGSVEFGHVDPYSALGLDTVQP